MKAYKSKKTRIISLAIFIALILIASLVFFKTPDNINSFDLPSYALINNDIKEAYLFTKENPEALNGVNCHCGCMKYPHEGRVHKRGLLDCFFKDNNIDYDSHGANCGMCIYDALEVKQLLSQNKTKEEIKKIINGKYS